jgi:hypothetical protein
LDEQKNCGNVDNGENGDSKSEFFCIKKVHFEMADYDVTSPLRDAG